MHWVSTLHQSRYDGDIEVQQCLSVSLHPTFAGLHRQRQQQTIDPIYLRSEPTSSLVPRLSGSTSGGVCSSA